MLIGEAIPIYSSQNHAEAQSGANSRWEILEVLKSIITIPFALFYGVFYRDERERELNRLAQPTNTPCSLDIQPISIEKPKKSLERMSKTLDRTQKSSEKILSDLRKAQKNLEEIQQRFNAGY